MIEIRVANPRVGGEGDASSVAATTGAVYTVSSAEAASAQARDFDNTFHHP